jgi:hypothetical protein
MRSADLPSGNTWKVSYRLGVWEGKKVRSREVWKIYKNLVIKSQLSGIQYRVSSVKDLAALQAKWFHPKTAFFLTEIKV